MKKWQIIALLFGVLLLAAPLCRLASAEEEAGDYEDEEEDGAAAGGDDSEKDVVVVTAKNWDETVGKAKFALVEFYAPWCGHCKSLAPHYAKAATALKAVDPAIVIAKVDATAETELGTKYGVSGYPTIKWFVDGEVASDYNGPRDADGIAKWVQKKSGPAAATLETADELAKLEGSDEVIVLGYFKAFKGSDYDAFIKVAQSTDDVTFVQTTVSDVAKAAGLKKHGITAITNFPSEERETTAASGDLKEFVTSVKLPPTIEFNDANSQKIFNSGIAKQLLLVAKAADLESDSAAFKAYRDAAKGKLKGKLVFVTVNLDGQSKDPVVNFFGIKEENAPVLVGFEMEKNKKYTYKGELTVEGIEEFGQGVLDGTAHIEYKSAEIPENDLDGHVKIVVGKSFDAIVKDPTKDVLLEVYAPWCGHCKALEPTWKKLAKRFKGVDSVVIAKMDGTENEHADVEVKGFPTILFFPAGEDKVAQAFEGGDRSVKGFTKFLKKHAKVPFTLPKKGKGDDKAEDEAKDEL
jgi:protein disulfide-isomerase A1